LFEIAADAQACVEAGARVIHFHVFDEAGKETFDPELTAAALRAVRVACSGVPLSLSTSAEIEPNPDRRRELIRRWTVLPDLVTANQGEEGIADLCLDLLSRGVGIEAGLLALRDAEAFVHSGLAERCARVLLEPLDADPADAVRHAASMEATLADAGITLEQVHHGDGIASWAVNERALRRGHGIRTGLEDTPLLPDGTLAPDNASLVRASMEMVKRVWG
jgi:uncharacterized protein (DUF849 family)